MKFEEVYGRTFCGEPSQREAAEILGISGRTFRRWRDRFEAEGAEGLYDRRRGRVSARQPARRRTGRRWRVARRYSGEPRAHLGVPARQPGGDPAGEHDGGPSHQLLLRHGRRPTDAPEIKAHSRSLGHVPIVDINPRCTPGLQQELADQANRQRLLGHRLAEDIRYHERRAVERVDGRLTDDFGAPTIRVRGHDKVMCPLMFGIVALSVHQWMRWLL